MSPCACGAQVAYESCCGPLHEGRGEAATPEQLMRSRFAAFKLGRVGYLWQTLHRDHDDKSLDPNAYLEHLRAGLKGLVYKDLEIFDRDGPDAEGIARVLFRASILSRGKDASFVELSSFAREESGWRYLFGLPVEAKHLRAGSSRLTISRIGA